MKKTLQLRPWCLLFLMLLSAAVAVGPAHSQNEASPEKPQKEKSLMLSQAAICEDIKDYLPFNRAVVFSLEIGKVYCFSSFSVVPEKMYIFHNWYRQDRLITTKRLLLQPPDWATTSSIQLREADKGPWRVEVKDQNNHLIKVLRFSITD